MVMTFGPIDHEPMVVNSNAQPVMVSSSSVTRSVMVSQFVSSKVLPANRMNFGSARNSSILAPIRRLFLFPTRHTQFASVCYQRFTR
jgi:hypothetical protein